MTTSTPTQRLRLEKQATGQNLNTWGQRLNDSGIALIEEAIAGVTAKALSGNVTLTSTNYEADESRRAVLVFTDDGLTEKPTVTIPAVQKLYLVHNKGSVHDIDITCGGAAATIGAGLIVAMYCDGTDCFNTDEARLAEIAKDAAEAAQLAAEGARDDAIDAKNDAEAAAIATDLDRTAVAEDRTAVENALETAEITIASEAEAVAGENNSKLMTPLRTAQAIVGQGDARYILDDDDTVKTANIEDEAVTEPKIADDAVTEDKIADDAVTLAKLAAEVKNAIAALNPPGKVDWFARETAPDGWLKANGAAVSRSTYADLFAAIGETYGAGDGSTTFNLPDLRGEFVRGWDDGRGVDDGRAFGSTQTDEIASHSHGLGAVLRNQSGSAANISGSASPTLAAGGTSDAFGGTETRPRNIALLACIKY